MLLNVPGSIPSSFKVYMAGVSAVADGTPRAGACIHHPGGGAKRIATAAGPCAFPVNSCVLKPLREAHSCMCMRRHDVGNLPIALCHNGVHTVLMTFAPI